LNTLAISCAFFSANSGLVLYLIKVRFVRLSIGSIAGSAVRHHRVSAARRLAQAKVFPQKKYFWGRLPPPLSVRLVEAAPRQAAA